MVEAVPIVLQWPTEGAEPLAGFPHHGAGAGALALMPAVQHRPAREHDGRQIDGRRRHQAGRRRLVAARRQHDAVEGIAEQHFDKAEIGEIAVERGGRALAGFLDRMGRELHRDAAGRADAFADPVRQFEMVAVARRQVVAGLGDADDRLAGLQFLPGQPVIEVALQIKRGHARVGWIVEPLAGAEFAGLAVACGIMPVGFGFFHWFLPPCKLAKARFRALMSILSLPCAISCAIPAIRPLGAIGP
jgi:hypothetical protein